MKIVDINKGHVYSAMIDQGFAILNGEDHLQLIHRSDGRISIIVDSQGVRLFVIDLEINEE